MRLRLFQINKPHSRDVNFSFTSPRFYSTSSSSKMDTPTPIINLTDLKDKDYIYSKRELVSKKGGMYRFLNKVNENQYIASAKDLYVRLNEHLSHRKSNKTLQAASLKYGFANFHFCIYEYFTYKDKATSFKLFTDLETLYIKKFNFSNLYNFLENASSSEGYKHTGSAKQKRIKRLQDKSNYPFCYFFFGYL